MVAPPFCLAALITQSLQMRQGNGEEEVEDEEEEKKYTFGIFYYWLYITYYIHPIYIYGCYYLLLVFCIIPATADDEAE